MFEDVLEQVECESTESVSMGNHNFSEIALEREVQNPLEAWSVEVESRADVGDGGVVGVLGFELFSLSLKITRLLLMGRGNSRIDNVRFLTLTFEVGLDDRVDIIESLSSGSSNVMDEVLIGPTSEGLV